MGDQITDYGKESEGTSEDLLRNQKTSFCIKLYGTATDWKYLSNSVCMR